MRPNPDLEIHPPSPPASISESADPPASAPSCRRDTLTGRVVRRTLCARNVAAAVGEITPGCEIFGVTKGDWSLVDLITYSLKTTGPANVIVCTWTAGGHDTSFTNDLLVDGSIKSLRFVVDLSFPSRQPSYCAALRQRFGDDAIRFTKTHAKFVTIRNATWNIVIRSSMNLNENRRMETWELSDSHAMAEWLDELVTQLFVNQTPEEAHGRTAAQHAVAFDTEWDDDGEHEPGPADQDFFGDGPHSVDLRRAGISRRGATPRPPRGEAPTPAPPAPPDPQPQAKQPKPRKESTDGSPRPKTKNSGTKASGRQPRSPPGR